MTYNVHQLLHLRELVEDLGPVWSHSCFFFEDLNGYFRDLFHGTQNIDGQVNTFFCYIPVIHKNFQNCSCLGEPRTFIFRFPQGGRNKMVVKC